MLAYMGWNLVLSDHGYLVYRHEAEQLQTLRKQVTSLKQQRERMAQEVLRLRHDPEALEGLVHRELGYVYPDEFMLIMPKKAVDSGQSAVDSRDASGVRSKR